MALVQTRYDDRYYLNCTYDTSLIDLDLDSRTRECKKAKTSVSIISNRFQSIWFRNHLAWIQFLGGGGVGGGGGGGA